MRLLFVTETYPSGLSGSSVKTRAALEFLLHRGHRVDVACVDFQSLAKEELIHPRVRIYGVYKLGIRKLRLGLLLRLLQLLFSIKPVIAARMFDARLQDFVDTLLYSQKYDYIFFEGFSCLQYARRRHKRFIYIDHEDITDLMRQRFLTETNWVVKLFYLSEHYRCLLYERKYLPLVHQIWAISPKTHRRLRTVSSVKTLLMPTIVHLGANVFNLTSHDLVFSGSLSWPENKNGLKWFLNNCWTGILRAFPNTNLYITGQQADAELEREFNRYPNIRFVGLVKNLEDVYKRIGIAISPVFINRGIKIKILTYMRYGLPVVATRESTWGLKYDGGVVSSTKNNFANTIIRILSDNKRRRELSRVSYTSIKKYYSEETLSQFFTDTAKISI